MSSTAFTAGVVTGPAFQLMPMSPVKETWTEPGPPAARCAASWSHQASAYCSLCDCEYCNDCAQHHPPCHTGDDETSSSEDDAFTQASVKDTCHSTNVNHCRGFTWMSVILSLLLDFVSVINYFSAKSSVHLAMLCAKLSRSIGLLLLDLCCCSLLCQVLWLIL